MRFLVPNPALRSLLYILALVLVCGIKPTSNAQDVDTNAEFFDDGSRNKVERDATKLLPNQNSLKHPAAASRWRTQELLMQAPLPRLSLLRDCRSEVMGLAANALNNEDLMVSRNILTQAIARAREVYHWCFYTNISQLDQKLESFEVSLTFEKKYQLFIQEMKSLWILSAALSLALRDPYYAEYLTARYIEMSKRYFGRDLQVVTPPLGSTPSQPPASPRTKPAGRQGVR